jgi:hypothetical protein
MATMCVRIGQLYESKEYSKLHSVVQFIVKENAKEKDVDVLVQSALQLNKFLNKPEIFGFKNLKRQVLQNYFVDETNVLFLITSRAINHAIQQSQRDEVEELLAILMDLFSKYPKIVPNLSISEERSRIFEMCEWNINECEDWNEMMILLESFPVNLVHLFIENILPKLIDKANKFLEE